MCHFAAVPCLLVPTGLQLVPIWGVSEATPVLACADSVVRVTRAGQMVY